ncbi:hypothetical protein RJD24_15760 [Bacillaceae bacterium IKA-2]|nr:hypothetical protein RJD24_15760 [Bacillaceae bacterium IKA-2]
MWLQTLGITGLQEDLLESTHTIDACAAALAAWHWGDKSKQPEWHWDLTTASHPYELCC